MPNTMVKLLSADGTARVTLWESRTLPGLMMFRGSSMVEHSAVNRRVEGSSPFHGAIFIFWCKILIKYIKQDYKFVVLFFYLYMSHYFESYVLFKRNFRIKIEYI